jgi:hypothetical protein
LCEPGSTSDFFQGANSRIGPHLHLNDLHVAFEYLLVAQAETIRRYTCRYRGCPENGDGVVCPNRRPRASRDFRGGTSGRESRHLARGIARGLTWDYEIRRSKLEKMCGLSHFLVLTFLVERTPAVGCEGG